MSSNFPGGRALPPGGLAGDVPIKQSSAGQDVAWGSTLSTPAANVPAVAVDVTLPNLAASYNALLLALKAAGIMVDD